MCAGFTASNVHLVLSVASAGRAQNIVEGSRHLGRLRSVALFVSLAIVQEYRAPPRGSALVPAGGHNFLSPSSSRPPFQFATKPAQNLPALVALKAEHYVRVDQPARRLAERV